MSFLFDTNVVSEPGRPSPSPPAMRFIRSCARHERFVSVVTLAELRYGVEKHLDPIKRQQLQQWFNLDVRPQFDGQVLEISEDIMVRWRVLVQAGRSRGHTYAQPDLIIAATALHHDLTLVTRNTSDFVHTGVKLLNPWVE